MKPTLFLAILLVIMQLGGTTANVLTGDDVEDHRGNETDRIALLGIKSELIMDHPRGVLSSWNHSLHHCHWEGVTCGHSHRRVIVLDLNSKNLSGTISPFIGNLSFLRHLWLYKNSLQGQIPPEVGRLFRLRKLYLTNNTLVGGIPSNLSGCLNLEELAVGGNKLEGNLPMEFGALTKLKMLEVIENNFTGPLFKVIANLTSLEEIHADFNAFTEIIPNHSVARMRSLAILALLGNEFYGVIPSSIFNLSSLIGLELGFNHLRGSLPSDIGYTLPRLQGLILDVNYFSGPLPISITNITTLEFLELANNHFTNRVPLDFGNLHNLMSLILSFNNLGGNINLLSTLTNCSSLMHLNLRGNHFMGLLPNDVANLSTNLRFLDMGSNQISGRIPSGISNLINLRTLYMDDNQFTGIIPHHLGKLQNIEDMELENNRLTGSIPNFFGNLSHLGKLFLGANNLQGRIPPSLGSCEDLLFLNLSYNDLRGPLPNDLFGGSSKLVGLDLTRNQLEGSLPSNIDKQKNLVDLFVSQNRLSGEIPNSLASCTALDNLLMDGNFFHGSIPPSFMSLLSLQEMNLSHNNLSGSIPDYLSKFPLEYLDLSYNHFEGRVPTNGVFANASAISVAGNGRLCGGIPQLDLPRCAGKDMNKRKGHGPLKLIIPIICALIGVTLTILTWLYLTCLKKKRKSDSLGSLISGAFLKVSYNILLKATDGFSSEKLLGSGTFGSVFKGILEPDGKIVAVKVLNLQHRGASKSFMAECKILRNIRHRNLLEIITACSSIDFQGNDFKALVYKFMPQGNLDKWLHEEYGNLGLDQRVDIAIDVAYALNYLHNDCKPPIVHCDLKPSNILLDEDMVAHVGDFGLAKFLSQHQNQNQSNSIGIRGTIGYAAPEYGLGGEASMDGDIYSFGILLLELITGKRPTNNMFREDLNLPLYAKTALPDQVVHIVDPILIEQESEDVDERRPNQATLQQRVECIVEVVKIGVACSNESPQDRMRIKGALNELQRARNIISNPRRRRNLQRGP